MQLDVDVSPPASIITFRLGLLECSRYFFKMRQHMYYIVFNFQGPIYKSLIYDFFYS